MQILFAITLFTSATLLFLVQPMFAKRVLPLLGGTPGVWNTCMVFYQAMLLAGYVYAHCSTRLLGPRRQAVLHLFLLALPWVVLPIGIIGGGSPPSDSNPTLWLLVVLTASVGLPFFVVSASAPMLQAWFADTGHPSAHDPYYLYAASNLGSMVALLGYPLLVEPRLTRDGQAWAWSLGFGLLGALTLACAAALWLSPKMARAATAPNGEAAAAPAADPLTLGRRLRWLALSLVPSSLLLGVTTHISMEIAAVPLLWVIPLALYLLTFVLVFSRRQIVPHRWVLRLQPVLIIPLAAWLFLSDEAMRWSVVPAHLAVFFIVAMACHGELAADRPSARHLTEFYLWMSLGGVLGGLLNAIVAPQLFTWIAEYPLMLAVACMLRPARTSGFGDAWLRRLVGAAPGPRDPHHHQAPPIGWVRGLDLALPALLVGLVALAAFVFRQGYHTLGSWGTVPGTTVTVVVGVLCLAFVRRPVRLGLGVAAVMLAGNVLGPARGDLIHGERTFFGVLRVKHTSNPSRNELLHGTILHGSQNCDPDPARRDRPLTYYYPSGPLGQVFAARSKSRPPHEIAAIGLGTGSIAGYGQPGQQITFYEIDPAVERIAKNPDYFTYLTDCPAQVHVVLGDARLRLKQAPPGRYDLMILDAYSSDAIPLHLVTREALQLYLDKLAEHGILALHISNRYFALAPVLGRLADDAHPCLVARVQWDADCTNEETSEGKERSHWVIMARQNDDLAGLIDDSRWEQITSDGPLWTDDFSNIVSVLTWWRELRTWTLPWRRKT